MPSTDLRQHLGRRGEQLAAEHLERLGYAIVARNHRTRFGELDIVAARGDELVFVEVKTRRGGPRATSAPWDALHDRKQTQVRRMAAAYLAEVTERPHGSDLRFDAIGITIDARGQLVALDHLEGAF
jgi:putative endonuclease